ncbi:hypothetical protein ABT008_14925 [Micromonospora sp. NPDC002389]|uniref:hypothetical protein n=1 Tax=Micromonospora sp. NPDC002389 TaxID=3154272 RepID=UPI00332473B5
MTERNHGRTTSRTERHGTVVRAANYLLAGDGKGNRSTRLAGAVIDRVIEKEGGRMTGRVIVAILVVLGVVGLAFVAYRLLVLDLILTLVRERE